MHIQIWSLKRMQRRFAALSLILSAGLVLWYPQAVATGVSRGLSLCGGVVIPSLFVFLVLSGVCVRTGVSAAIGRRMSRPMHVLYRLPGCSAAALLISLVGGYPAGAAAVRELLDRRALTVPQAKRLLRGCVNAGPAFVIGGVGAVMLGNVQKGAVLFLAQLLASLLTGMLCCRDGEEEIKDEQNVPTDIKPLTAEPAALALVESVNTACRSMLYLCGFVVISAAALSLMDATGMTAFLTNMLCVLPARLGLETAPLASLIPGFLEVSCGCMEAAGTGETAPLFLGLILGWGGISVHGQVAAATSGYPLIDRCFFMARGIQAALTGVLSMLLFRIIPISQSTLSAGDGTIVYGYATSVTAAAALLMLCGSWLLCVPASRKE